MLNVRLNFKKMKIPKITGTIERRILINYQVDKDVVAKFLPEPFRPKLVNDRAVVGICLIRLKNIRLKGLPKFIGISSENGAHRIAVEWTDKEGVKEGVYIPRRDTSSKLNSLAGGRIFPGVHHFADFKVDESDGNYSVEFRSEDDTFLSVKAQETKDWNADSIFKDLDCARCGGPLKHKPVPFLFRIRLLGFLSGFSCQIQYFRRAIIHFSGF